MVDPVADVQLVIELPTPARRWQSG
jgi:hypothetical protein